MKKSFSMNILMTWTISATTLMLLTVRQADASVLKKTTSVQMEEGESAAYTNCYGAENCFKASNGYGEAVYYTLSGPTGDKTMTIYGPKTGDAVSVPQSAFRDPSGGSNQFPAKAKTLNFQGNVNIERDAFRSITGLTSVDLTGVQEIKGNAFEAATGLTSIDLSGVKKIESGAFHNAATGLTSIVVPESVFETGGSLSDTAFWHLWVSTVYCPQGQSCSNLRLETSSYIANQIPYVKDETGVYYLTDNSGKPLPSEDNPLYYASATDMQTGATASCGTHDACLDIVAANMANKGTYCSGVSACRNLLTMVGDANETCGVSGGGNKSIAACSSYAQSQGIVLANLYGSGSSNEQNGQAGASKSLRGKRIYTVDEANAIAGRKNKVMIRYK